MYVRHHGMSLPDMNSVSCINKTLWTRLKFENRDTVGIQTGGQNNGSWTIVHHFRREINLVFAFCDRLCRLIRHELLFTFAMSATFQDSTTAPVNPQTMMYI